MPDILPETVTEEQYTDEHGHIVVKKVGLPLNYVKHTQILK